MESEDDYDQLEDEEIEALEMGLDEDGKKLCFNHLTEYNNTSILVVELCDEL